LRNNLTTNALCRILVAGGFYSQSVYLSWLLCLSVHRWSGKDEKALWQGLAVALALCVLSMCLAAKGRCSWSFLSSIFH